MDTSNETCPEAARLGQPGNYVLVCGWATPLKNMKVSWGSLFPTEWKVIKFMFQTTNRMSQNQDILTKGPPGHGMPANLCTQHLTININKQQLKGHKLKQCKQTLRSAQVYKDPFFACTMASKAAWTELARKRCTLWRAVLVLPNMEVDSVAREIEPSRDTHGYWPQRGFTVSKGRTFESSCKHLPARQRHITITPTTQDAQDVEASPSHLLHQQYPSISVNIRQCLLPCLTMIMTCWDNCAVKFQPAALRLVLSNRCPSHLKGSLMD